MKNVLEHFKKLSNTRRPPMQREALLINSLQNLSVPTYRIFSNEFPQHFTIFAAAKYVNYTGGYLVSFYDIHDKFQIGIKISMTSVQLEYAQNRTSFNAEVIDRKWHRFAFSVGNGLVTFYLDCEMMGTRNMTMITLDRVDNNGITYLNLKAALPGEQKNIEVR